MKISALLENTIIMVAQFNKPSRASNLTYALLDFEETRTWQKLTALLDKWSDCQATLENLTPFKNFLGKRWERIKDTYQLHYTFTYSQEITKICEALATALATTNLFLAPESAEPLHRYELLMPTLDTSGNVGMTFHELDVMAVRNLRAQLAGEELAEGAHTRILQLHHFILDDEHKPIIVSDCLEAASEDTILRHSYALHEEGSALNLEETFQTRVKYHSREAYAVYQAIKELHAERRDFYTAGGALKLLIEALHAGDMRHGGTEYEAGEAAFAGIVRFYHFLKTLSKKDLNKVYAFQCRSPLHRNIKVRWFVLLATAVDNGKISIPPHELAEVKAQINRLGSRRAVPINCVYLIANIFQTILDKNTAKLYAIKSNSSVHTAMQQFDKIAEKEASYKQAIADLHLATAAAANLHHFPQREIQNKSMLIQKALFLEHNLSLREFSRAIINDVKDLSELINAVSENSRSELITELLKRRYITTIVKYFDNLKTLLTNIPKDTQLQCTILRNFNPLHLKGIITSAMAWGVLQQVLTADAVLLLATQILGAGFVARIAAQQGGFTTTHVVSQGLGFFKPGHSIKRVASASDLFNFDSDEETPSILKKRRIEGDSAASPAEGGNMNLSITIPDADMDDDVPLSQRLRRR